MRRRTALPVLLALAGVSWCTAQAMQQDMGTTHAERLANVAQGRELQMASVALMFAAGCLLVLSAIAIGRRLPTGRGAALVKLGGLLLGLGGIWLAAGRGAFSLLILQLTGAGLDPASAAAVLDADPGFAFFGLIPTLPSFILGPVLLGLGVGLHYRSWSAWAPLACWVAGITVFVVSEFISKPGEVAGVGLAAAGLVLLGIRIRPGRSAGDTPTPTAGQTKIKA